MSIYALVQVNIFSCFNIQVQDRYSVIIRCVLVHPASEYFK